MAGFKDLRDGLIKYYTKVIEEKGLFDFLIDFIEDRCIESGCNFNYLNEAIDIKNDNSFMSIIRIPGIDCVPTLVIKYNMTTKEDESIDISWSEYLEKVRNYTYVVKKIDIIDLWDTYGTDIKEKRKNIKDNILDYDYIN